MKRNISVLNIILSVIVLAACQKDYYDPESIRNDFIISDIPSGFDWSSFSDVSIRISPNDNFSGNFFYSIEVLDKNPLYTEATVCYAKGFGNSRQPFQFTASLPDGKDTLFVRQTSPGGSVSVYQVARQGNQLSADLTPAAATSSYQMPGQLRLNLPATGYPTPADATELTAQTGYTLQSGQSYVLRGNYTGRINFPGQGNVKLYVEGQWTNTASGNDQIEDRTYIIIQQGASIAWDSPSTLNVVGNSVICIAEGAKFNPSNADVTVIYQNTGELVNLGDLRLKKLETKSNAKIYNKGTLRTDSYSAASRNETTNDGVINANKIDLTGNSFVNSSTGNINVEEFSTEGATVENYGKFDVSGLDVKRGSFTNHCQVHVNDELDLEGTALNLEGNSIFQGKTAEIAGTTLKSAPLSLLKITQEAVFSDWASTIQGPSSQEDPGLIQINEVSPSSGSGWKVVNYKGNLEIKCRKHASEQYYSLSLPARFISGNFSVNIKPGDCNDEGNTPDPEDPVNPEFPKAVTISSNLSWMTEDTYPGTGDYDLNDMVVSIDSVILHINSQNQAETMQLEITLRAVGATKRIGAAIQLDKLVPGNIRAITRIPEIPMNENMFQTAANGTEQDQTMAVIPLFDNAHTLLGADNTVTLINTFLTGSRKPASHFTVKIDFASPIGTENITLKQLNVFAIIGLNVQPKRTEIHTPEYNHTDKSVTPQKVQQNTKGLMWGLIVPGQFRYPFESIDIRKAYPGFEKWISSNKETDKNWYEYPTEENIYK